MCQVPGFPGGGRGTPSPNGTPPLNRDRADTEQNRSDRTAPSLSCQFASSVVGAYCC